MTRIGVIVVTSFLLPLCKTAQYWLHRRHINCMRLCARTHILRVRNGHETLAIASHGCGSFQRGNLSHCFTGTSACAGVCNCSCAGFCPAKSRTRYISFARLRCVPWTGGGGHPLCTPTDWRRGQVSWRSTPQPASPSHGQNAQWWHADPHGE
jgi:hypothetical protein